MPTYKLYYFNFMAMGEPVRFLLSYGGADFEDVRIEFGKEWPALKSKMPMGQMPVLEIDGKQTYQSIAICRHLANEFKIAGNDNWENLQIDIAVDTINDLRLKTAQAYWEQNEVLKAEKLKVVLDELLPFYLQKLDDLAKANNGHFALGRLTWADIFFGGCLDYLDGMTKQDVTANYPNLKAVKNNVLAIENIKKWIAKRPASFL